MKPKHKQKGKAAAKVLHVHGVTTVTRGEAARWPRLKAKHAGGRPSTGCMQARYWIPIRVATAIAQMAKKADVPEGEWLQAVVDYVAVELNAGARVTKDGKAF